MRRVCLCLLLAACVVCAQGVSARPLSLTFLKIDRRFEGVLIPFREDVRQTILANWRPDGPPGRVGLSFSIDRRGRVSDVALSESSRCARLDQSAIQAIFASSPFQVPPTGSDLRINAYFDSREIDLSTAPAQAGSEGTGWEEDPYRQREATPPPVVQANQQAADQSKDAATPPPNEPYKAPQSLRELPTCADAPTSWEQACRDHFSQDMSSRYGVRFSPIVHTSSPKASGKGKARRK